VPPRKSRVCALGDLSEIDPQAYATLASTMLRIGSKLGLQRRHQRTIEPDLKTYLELAGEEATPADDEAEP
jgi:hypothetical protein